MLGLFFRRHINSLIATALAIWHFLFMIQHYEGRGMKNGLQKTLIVFSLLFQTTLNVSLIPLGQTYSRSAG